MSIEIKNTPICRGGISIVPKTFFRTQGTQCPVSWVVIAQTFLAMMMTTFIGCLHVEIVKKSASANQIRLSQLSDRTYLKLI